MLVARAQLNFIRDLVARFERGDRVMRPLADFQSQYVAVTTLLRSVDHGSEEGDRAGTDRHAWSKARWTTWKAELA